MRILVVEDEYNLADVIRCKLKQEAYVVDIATDGKEGLEYALTGIYDLIILDIMLPSMNGFDILKEIRRNEIQSKVIILTAKDEIDDKLTGFAAGADDYLTKPFHIDELAARAKIQLKGSYQYTSPEISFGDLVLNLKTSMISSTITHEEIEVSHKEYLLIEYFIRNPHIIITRETIYDKIWGLDNEVESNSLEAYLSFIRRKFRSIGTKVNIKAIRGFGYKIEVKGEKTKR